MKSKKKTGISRLLEISGEKKGLLICSSILSVFSAVFMLVPFVAIYKILSELLSNINNVSAMNSGLMINWGWIAFAGLIGGLILLYASSMCSHIAAFKILYGIRMALTKHIGKLPLGYLSTTNTGAVKKKLEQDVERIEVFIAHTIPDIVNAIATVIIMFVIFISLNVWMALTVLLVFIASIALQGMLMFGEKSKEGIKSHFDSLERINSSSIQYVRGIPVVKIFGQTVHSFKRFHKDLYEYRDWAVKHCDNFENGMCIFLVLLNSFLTFILPVGLLILTGDPTNIALALVYLFFIVMIPGVASPLYKMTILSASMKMIFEGVERIDEIFEEATIAEPIIAKSPKGYDVVFENVNFAYENKIEATRVQALENISFTAKSGEITALVGPSGGGKSTIANLIPRFFDINEGEIKIGGVNLKEIGNKELMNIVSFVFQDTFLFYDTLFENIKVGNPNATVEQVYEAAKAAQCHDFILSLPKGYNTLIGEGGVFLSGGEEQRVAVARAILKNSPILVLDEATAFADPENEYKMQNALKELIKNKTVIVIAHRLSSIKTADKIIVLKEGKIQQMGTHEELTSKGGLYNNMWEAYINAHNWKLNIGGKKV